MIETPNVYIQSLQEELHVWREWCLEWQHGEGPLKGLLAHLKDEQSEIENKDTIIVKEKHGPIDMQHPCGFSNARSQKQVLQQPRQHQQHQGLIDYSKWDKLSCYSPSSAGNGQSHEDVSDAEALLEDDIDGYDELDETLLEAEADIDGHDELDERLTLMRTGTLKDIQTLTLLMQSTPKPASATQCRRWLEM